MDKRYEKLRWNPNVNRILAQRGFRKIRALMKIFSIRKGLVHHVLGLIKRIPIRKRLSHQGREINPLLL